MMMSTIFALWSSDKGDTTPSISYGGKTFFETEKYIL